MVKPMNAPQAKDRYPAGLNCSSNVVIGKATCRTLFKVLFKITSSTMHLVFFARAQNQHLGAVRIAVVF